MQNNNLMTVAEMLPLFDAAGINIKANDAFTRYVKKPGFPRAQGGLRLTGRRPAKQYDVNKVFAYFDKPVPQCDKDGDIIITRVDFNILAQQFIRSPAYAR